MALSLQHRTSQIAVQHVVPSRVKTHRQGGVTAMSDLPSRADESVQRRERAMRAKSRPIQAVRCIPGSFYASCC
jgi:hypothetical protein